MVRKFVTTVVLAGSFALMGCNTVEGAGEDIKSVAQCTEEMMKTGQC